MLIMYLLICVSASYWFGCFVGEHNYKRKIQNAIQNIKSFNVINGLDAIEGYIERDNIKDKLKGKYLYCKYNGIKRRNKSNT